MSRLADQTPRTFDAVLSDLDGVLVDSSEQHHRVMGRWARRHGLDPELVIGATQGVRNRDFIPMLAPASVIDVELDVIASWAAEESHDVRSLPGALELLNGELATAAVAVVTSSSAASVRQRLSVAGLKIPSTLVTAESVTEGKPHPAGYVLAAELLRVDIARCLVIEDSPAGVAAGLAAGATVAAVRTTHSDDLLQDAHLIEDSIAAVARRFRW